MSKERIEQLVSEITQLDRSYYGEGKSLASDKEYDLLYKELVALEKEFPQFASASSPTQRVGDDLTEGFGKVTHSIPMMSIDNSYEAFLCFVKQGDELMDFNEINLSSIYYK